jgi:hypothetical protein
MATPPAHANAADPGANPDLTLTQVVARLSAAVSVPLTQALDRVVMLASSGSIDRRGLSALRHEIDDARRAGLLGQQIARFADGGAQPGVERVDLGAVLAEVLSDHAAHAQPGAQGHAQAVSPASVMGDASLIHTLLQAAVAWSVANASSRIDWSVEVETWQPQARLTCRFACATTATGHEPGDGLDSLDWLLLRYAAHLAGVSVARDLADPHCLLTLRFRHVVTEAPEVPEGAPARASPGVAPTHRALLTGCQLLVLASRREARQRVRDALRGHEVFIDYVPSVAAAEAYCDDGSPQVLLYESPFAGDALRALQARLGKLTPAVTMIELMPAGQGCETGTLGLRVGAEGLAQTLPSVLLMALSQRD